MSDQIRFFLSNEAEKEINNSSITTTQQTEIDEEDEEEQTNEIRSEQPWTILLAVTQTTTPNTVKPLLLNTPHL